MSFRVTRNANTERDEDEADDLLALIDPSCAIAASRRSCGWKPCKT